MVSGPLLLRSRTRTPGLRGVAWVLVAVATAAVSGCYNPKVPPGSLRCASPPAKQCPDGLICAATGFCEEAGTGGGGKGGHAGTGGAGGAACANPIPPACQTPAGAAPTGCDPVCQTGCACGLRCNVINPVPQCVAVAGMKAVGAICDPATDPCAPGLVCLRERCGTNLGRCFRFCRDFTDCGTNGVCGTPTQLTDGGTSPFKVCNVADQMPACDAYGRTGCPDTALVCYLASPNTKCDCPSGKNRLEGEVCEFYNDCVPGLICLNLAGVSQCRRLCRTSADCAGGAACTFTGTSGYCP